MSWASNSQIWYVVQHNGYVPVSSGGTGATTAAGARTNLEITPANIGAVNKAGDTMTGQLRISFNDYPSLRGTRTDSGEASIYLENNTSGWALGVNTWGQGANSFAIGKYMGGNSGWCLKIDDTGLVSLSKALPVASGGTGATTAAGARANLGVNDIGPYQAQSAITPVNDDQVHNITISADCWVCVSIHVTANINGGVIVWRNSIPVINNGNTNGACNYWANAQFPCKAGGLLQYRLNSNATDSYISFLTV